jgi:nucleoside-diphosphate kinase
VLAGEDGSVLVAGSIYLGGTVRAHLAGRDRFITASDEPTCSSDLRRSPDYRPPMAIEHTFIMIKPDGVRRRAGGRGHRPVRAQGVHPAADAMLEVTEDIARNHYAEHVEKPFFPELLEFITSGPVVAMEWSGESAVSAARTMMGPTNPVDGRSRTIRGDLALVITENIVHGSDSPESAERELVDLVLADHAESWR